MDSETFCITKATYKEISKLGRILESENKGELIDFAIFACTAMIDVLPDVYLHKVYRKAMDNLRDYYDSPVGISNQ